MRKTHLYPITTNNPKNVIFKAEEKSGASSDDHYDHEAARRPQDHTTHMS
jgi:hypothetical protein